MKPTHSSPVAISIRAILAAMLAHVRDDKLVAWGWAPGGKRSLPPATRAETVAAFKTWTDAGAPCPM